MSVPTRLYILPLSQKQTESELKAQQETFRNVSFFSADSSTSSYLERLLQLMEGGRADTLKEAINIAVQEDKERLAEIRRQQHEADVQKMIQAQQEQYERDIKSLRQAEEERLEIEKKRLNTVKEIRDKLEL